ncbi:ABC transporter permease [Mahella australiensis]|uniref:Binding-protein-dependent transport systems inner membrane component n=1 Tax=Mahella australiensis (strain DSM 15567 / CIP 107919 / 50-1 BON) TaxID=697281 RepID=F4A0Q9_MAHA5|nr:ABC transporter permease subunit [Mahella australiensis]AEE96955.1 binding-protein-dependent transport systems inner membrane component [Mahella australiensis 50-1 BON]
MVDLNKIDLGKNNSSQKGFIYNIKRYRNLYIMFLPVIICLILFNYLPMWGVILAFKDYVPWQGFWGSKWVGWNNFKFILASPDFPRLIRNTLLINIYKIIWGFPAPIILALLLNEVKNKYFKNTIQTISYLPYFISWIVVSGIMYNLLNTNFGVINNMLQSMGMEPVQWYGRADLWRSILVITNIWKSIGYSSIIYLAAISGIDPTLYEAAIVDGATRWQQTWHVTIPGIMPTVSILFILGIGGLMYGDFGQIYALVGYNSALYETTDVLDFYIYRVGMQGGRFSIGTALGLFQSIVGFIMVVTTNYLAKKMGGEGIW